MVNQQTVVRLRNRITADMQLELHSDIAYMSIFKETHTSGAVFYCPLIVYPLISICYMPIIFQKAGDFKGFGGALLAPRRQNLRAEKTKFQFFIFTRFKLRNKSYLAKHIKQVHSTGPFGLALQVFYCLLNRFRKTFCPTEVQTKASGKSYSISRLLTDGL